MLGEGGRDEKGAHPDRDFHISLGALAITTEVVKGVAESGRLGQHGSVRGRKKAWLKLIRS